MYTVLLADDDPMALSYLKGMVDWERCGFSLAGEAGNGTKALQLYQELQPDLIISDIRMPGLNGIELAREVGRLGDPVKIILLSAYEDFHYARQALDLGVSQYLLKHTLSSEMLAGLLLELKQQMQLDFMRKAGMEKMLQEHRTSLQKIQELVFWEIVFGRANPNDTHRYLYEAPPPINFCRYCLLFLTAESKEEATLSTLADTYRTLLQHRFPALQFTVYRHANLFALLTSPDSGNPVPAERLQQELFRILRSASDGSLQAGCSHYQTTPEDFCNAVSEAMRMLYLATVSGQPPSGLCVCPPTDFPAASASDRYDTLQQAIRQNQTASIEHLLAVILLDAAGRMQKVSDIQGTIFKLNLLFDDLAKAYGYPEPSAVPGFGYCVLPQELYRCYCVLFQQLGSRIAEAEQHGTGKLAADTVRYLQKHYDQEITLQSVADHLGISRVYLSKIFKKETGVNFVDFLSRLRIRKAIELLQTSTLKVYEIAEMVGFKNAAYMSFCFKEETGKSPSDYRRG